MPLIQGDRWNIAKKLQVEIFVLCSFRTHEGAFTKKLLSQFKKKEGKWKKFAEFKYWNYGVWTIHIDLENLQNSSCTCPSYLKFLQCKHALGMQI